MKKNLLLSFCALILTSLFIVSGTEKISAQEPDSKKVSAETKKHRDQTISILREMKGVLKKLYYDANYHGINLDERFTAAEARIKTLEYNWQMYRVLVQVLMDFNDSHTVFHLPPRSDYFDYGFSMQMFGTDCFITAVKKDSDAEKQGLKVGDQILNIGKFKPTRDDLWKIVYVLYRLDPKETVDLTIAKLDGSQQKISVKARTMTQKEKSEELKKKKTKEKFEPFKCREVNSATIACKLSTFMVGKEEIDKMMKQVGNHSKMILDLRGNGGGFVDTEVYLLGYFFDRDVKVADMITREKTETLIAKSRGDRVFKGDLVVLTDSRSASASELTARVMQLENRAKVIGDVTMGAVVTSRTIPLFGSYSALSAAVYTSVSMSVTVADVKMKDGGRLENVGVVPDYPVIPTGEALSRKMDAVLAYAASLLGAELSPEKAGEFYFITSREIDEDLDPEEGDK
ncbi:MAG TPA: S41 family peptidase [Pyrinomonadaceae bacterium]|jgi:C-terminal processing protease CtpA/Prc